MIGHLTGCPVLSRRDLRTKPGSATSSLRAPEVEDENDDEDENEAPDYPTPRPTNPRSILGQVEAADDVRRRLLRTLSRVGLATNR